MSDRPSVLFVCVHNAGRSQMAAGWRRHLAGESVDVCSAGSEPADRIAVDAISDLDLSYTPPLGSPYDAVQTAAHDWTLAVSTRRTG